MDLEQINDVPYSELKKNAREAHKRVKAATFKWAAESSEDHIVLLWRGLYKNQPEYIDDGDFWISENNTEENFWDFLET